MPGRTGRERLCQAIGYEAGGALLSVPFCAAATGSDAGGSALLVAALSLATCLWSPLFNAAFDRVEARFCCRPAWCRRPWLRLVHACLPETSDMVVTVPILMGAGGLSLAGALAADLGMTALWILYTYLYHLAFDRLGRGHSAVPGGAGLAA